MSSFGNPTQGGNLFGGNTSTTNTNTGAAVSGTTQPSLFGGSFSQLKPGSLFGGTTNSAGATSGSSLFGNAGTTGASGTATGSTPASGGLFGTPTSTSTSGNTAGGGTSTLGSGGLFGGGASNTDTAAPSNSLFGGNNTSTTNTTALTGTQSLFGGSNSAFAPKPTENATSAKPATSSFFSQPSTEAGTGLFGLPQKPADAASTTTTGNNVTNTSASTGTTGGGLFGGGLFGKPATATSTEMSTTTSAPAPGAGLFGNNPAAKKDVSPSATTSSFNLFGAPKADDKKDMKGSAPNTTTSTEAERTQTPTSSNTLTSASAAPTVAVPPPSMLRGKTLEEIVNRWSTELETHTREFTKFAGEVAVWDRALIENGNNLAALHSHVLSAERQQNEIDQSLDHIEQQQKDLASTLDAYEKVSQDLLGGQGGNLRSLDAGPADTERDKNYMLATDLHTQLDDLSGSLTQMIESVNALLSSSGQNESGGDDAMSQIAQILSSHLESLQWIDSAVREVDGKVSDVEKRVKESGHNVSNNVPMKSRGFGLSR